MPSTGGLGFKFIKTKSLCPFEDLPRPRSPLQLGRQDMPRPGERVRRVWKARPRGPGYPASCWTGWAPSTCSRCRPCPVGGTEPHRECAPNPVGPVLPPTEGPAAPRIQPGRLSPTALPSGQERKWTLVCLCDAPAWAGTLRELGTLARGVNDWARGPREQCQGASQDRRAGQRRAVPTLQACPRDLPQGCVFLCVPSPLPLSTGLGVGLL